MPAHPRRLPLAALALPGLLALAATGCMRIPWRSDAVSRDAAFKILGRAPRRMTPAMKERAARLEARLRKGGGWTQRVNLGGKDIAVRTADEMNFWTLPIVGYLPMHSLQEATVGGETVQTYREAEIVMPGFPAAVFCEADSLTCYEASSGDEVAHVSHYGLGFCGFLLGRARELCATRDWDKDVPLATAPARYCVRKRFYILAGLLQFGRANRRYYMQVFLFPIPLWRAPG